jgi:hypothetical protein
VSVVRSFVNKTVLTAGCAGALLAGASLAAMAAPRALEPAPIATALSAADLLAGLRQLGLTPIGEPVLRGPYFVTHAYDPRGIEMRVLVDAQFGDIISVVPALPLNAVFAPPYQRAPRIIHVPPRGAREDGATDDGAAAPDRSELQSQPKRKPKPRKQAEAAPEPHRAVLSAPPPPADMTPAPAAAPVPRFEAPTAGGEKFEPQPPKNTP